MTQLTESVYAVEVPSDAFNLCVSENNELGYYANIEYFDKIHYDPLPPGSWQFICTTKDITEEQARGIVGSSEWYFPERHIRYIDYNHLVGPDGKQAWNIGFSNALLSLRSLLTSKGLDPNKNYALLKKG